MGPEEGRGSAKATDLVEKVMVSAFIWLVVKTEVMIFSNDIINTAFKEIDPLIGTDTEFLEKL